MLALAACAGAAVMWIGLGLYRRDSAQRTGGANEIPVRGAQQKIVKRNAWATIPPVGSAAPVSSRSSLTGNPEPVAQPAGDSTTTVPGTLAMNEGPLKQDPAARSKVLNALLDSSTISCAVSAAQGASWNDLGPQVHGISYQGGPFSFQAIDLQSGTATMTGDSGFTHGDLAARVTATDDGLYFVAFNRAGDLVIVTVYSAVDGAGHYRMVMSQHARLLNNESAQFYGACDTTLTPLQ
jgi:hypothetical protein